MATAAKPQHKATRAALVVWPSRRAMPTTLLAPKDGVVNAGIEKMHPGWHVAVTAGCIH